MAHVLRVLRPSLLFGVVACAALVGGACEFAPDDSPADPPGLPPPVVAPKEPASAGVERAVATEGGDGGPVARPEAVAVVGPSGPADEAAPPAPRQAVVPVGGPTGTIFWSASRDRSGAAVLDGWTIDMALGEVYIFATFTGVRTDDIERVVWWVDGALHRDDDLDPPYDMVPEIAPFSGAHDLARLGLGAHEIRADAHSRNGVVSAVAGLTVVDDFRGVRSTPTTTLPTSTTTVPAPPPVVSVPPSPPGVPAAGSVGFLGDPAGLKVIDGPDDAPPGTAWNSQYGYLDIRSDDVVLDGVWVKGGIDYYGGGTLTIRNSIVEGGYGSWMIVMLRDGGGSLDVRDSTLRWRPGTSPGAGSGSGVIQITGNHDDVVIIRNDISGNPDGIQVAGDGWTIRENWIHDLAMVGTYPDNTHNDGVQVYNGTGHRIVANRIEIGARSPYSNSPVFLQGASIGAVDIHGNLLDGGGYQLYLQNGDVSVIGNTFGPDHLWGDKRVDAGATITAWSGNVRHDGSESARP